MVRMKTRKNRKKVGNYHRSIIIVTYVKRKKMKSLNYLS